MPAYLITFTCYGSYIPGQQGAIDRDHNVPGSRLPAPRPKLRQHVDASLKQAPYVASVRSLTVAVRVARTLL
jgi:hypothetical protein